MEKTEMEKTEMEKLGAGIALARAQIAVLREENALLKDCLLEMSGAALLGGRIMRAPMTARLWTEEIMDGKKRYEQVPRRIRGQVRILLDDCGLGALTQG